jgi:hypothetical protein
VSKRLPFGGLTADVERQPTNAEIGKAILKDERYLRRRIHLPRSQTGRDPGIATANDEDVRQAPPGMGSLTSATLRRAIESKVIGRLRAEGLIS